MRRISLSPPCPPSDGSRNIPRALWSGLAVFLHAMCFTCFVLVQCGKTDTIIGRSDMRRPSITDIQMKHKKFEIHNFKGITSVTLDFSSHPNGRIYTLVGLNESGKTTVLEALDFWSYKSETLDPLGVPGYAQRNPHDLIPINQRANFNDSIIIQAFFELDATDENKNP